MWSFLQSALYKAHAVVLVSPLQQLYLRGAWKNRPTADICAELTQHRSSFWAQHADECQLVIANQFDSWLVYIYAALYLTLILFVGVRLLFTVMDIVTCRRRHRLP